VLPPEAGFTPCLMASSDTFTDSQPKSMRQPVLLFSSVPESNTMRGDRSGTSAVVTAGVMRPPALP
jgi:hypothetical protein